LPQNLAAWQHLADDHLAQAEDQRDLSPAPIHYLALLTFRLDAQRVHEVTGRLAIPRKEATFLHQVQELRELGPALCTADLPPSQIYRLLTRFGVDALMIMWMATARSRRAPATGTIPEPPTPGVAGHRWSRAKNAGRSAGSHLPRNPAPGSRCPARWAGGHPGGRRELREGIAARDQNMNDLLDEKWKTGAGRHGPP